MAFKIKIICFGTKRSSFQGEVDRYCKMARQFGQVDVDYIKPLNAQNDNFEDVLKREQKLIESKIPENSDLVILAEEGKLPGESRNFSSWLKQRKESSRNLVFVMGSAYGISNELKAKSSYLLSLSPLTMPYSLCLVVLVEQIYRAYTILSGHPYHK